MTMEFRKLFRRKQVVSPSPSPSRLPEFPELDKVRQLALENAQKAEMLAIEYKKAKEEAELANRFRSDFLANMSHELRTPLNAMLGYSEMMREDAEEAGLKPFSENLEKVIYSGKHLLSLINDILDLSKIESGTMKFYREDYSLKKLVAELDDFIKPLLVKNNNTFKITIKTDIEIIHTDISRIRQALLNLLDNANKFTKQGTITLDISSTGEWLQFDVIDTGVGIPKEYVRRLFQSFSQADPSITRKHGGTGLGLYLTKRFCELLGGSVQVKSEEGKGAMFSLMLPLTEKNSAHQKSEKASEKATEKENISEVSSQFQNKTALVISFDLAEDVLNDIKQMGFTVLHARTGQEGLRMARKNPPNIIVLDMSVSFSLNGALMEQWMMLSEIKSDDVLSAVPLVVMTQDVSQESLGFVLGEIDFLTKPVNISMMMRKIRQLVPDGLPTLLVVDDDESAREIMSAAAKKAGWKSIEAVNGRDALNKMADVLPSIILLDLMMPEMDGFTMINELQKNNEWQNIPVIIVSAKELSRGEREMLTKCTKGILQKGAYSRKDLIEAICDQVK